MDPLVCPRCKGTDIAANRPPISCVCRSGTCRHTWLDTRKPSPAPAVEAAPPVAAAVSESAEIAQAGPAPAAEEKPAGEEVMINEGAPANDRGDAPEPEPL